LEKVNKIVKTKSLV